MLLHLIGGGNSQLATARRIKDRGHTLLISDYKKDAPAKRYADFTTEISTFDQEGILNISREYKVDGILTTGTDQPVLTAAVTAAALNLPSFVTVEAALALTNKRVMKPRMVSAGIATIPFVLLKDLNTAANKIRQAELTYPIVIKPVDSQGQRGVLKIESESMLLEKFDYSMHFSREKTLVAEEYYPSDEITVSGWVQDGKLTLLTVTDRITEDNLPYIGVCYAHRCPSIYLEQYAHEIEDVSQAIRKEFSVENGPLYIQMLIGSKGIRINEIACRIGGAYEDEIIPHLSGIDIIDLLIDGSLGMTKESPLLRDHNLSKNSGFSMVLLFFAKPGLITGVGDFQDIITLPGVIGGAYHVTQGTVITEQENAIQRAGYVIITADSPIELDRRVESVYDSLFIVNDSGENCVIKSTLQS